MSKNKYTINRKLDDRRLSRAATKSPLVHFARNGLSLCGVSLYDHYHTGDINSVTCPVCMKMHEGTKGNVQFRYPNDGPATESKKAPNTRLTAKEYGQMLYRRDHPNWRSGDDED